MKMLRSVLTLVLLLSAVSRAAAAQSVARIWDEQMLSAIRIDKPHPPVHARNLFSVSVAMYDAWAAYDSNAVGFIYRGKHTAADVAAARHEAISYAAYRMLAERYALSVGAATTLPALASQLTTLGYNSGNTSTNTATPAGVGNSVYAAVSAWFLNDASRQTASPAYSDPSYTPVNDYLVTGFSGTTVVDVNRWQPLAIANAVDQNGIPTGPLQKFLGSQWISVRPFALTRTATNLPWINPGPPPLLNTATAAAFRSNVVECIRKSSEMTPDDGVTIDISPGSFGNNSLGANDGSGHATNPVTGSPYSPNVVKRGDFTRVLAEFWADGPNSETPPGHWNTLANAVADDTNFVKRFEGTGPVLDDLEWDIKVYFALNAAVHDAACAAWSLKRYYDGWRPIAAVRYMGQLGQSTTPGTSYHTNGLPIVPNLIELVTPITSQPFGRHAGLPVGSIAVLSWPGQPADPTNQYSGVKWIQAADWVPFQKANFVSPAFPGYISGHSTFSRSAAEVLTAITGSPYFPGGMATYTAISNSALTFEKGPSQTVQLQWASYYDAADQAGMSRIWGGIHPPVDDFNGRNTGSLCGKSAYALARQYFDGTITNTPLFAAIRNLSTAQCEISCNTIRGFNYQLQSTTNLTQSFTNEPAGAILATDVSFVKTNTTSAASKFFRFIRSY